MSKGLTKAIVFGAVFIISVVLFEFAMNHTNEDLTMEMENATLPVVEFYYQEEAVNELFGYVNEMEAVYMREDITPVDVDRVLPMKVRTYGYPVDGISYEIRSMDTSRLIAESDVTEYANEKGIIRADIGIQNLLEKDEEYLLLLTLQSNGKSIHYYTRLVEPADCYVKESLDFVKNFHETTFNPEAAATIAMYVEPNASGDNSTLHKVDIHSTLKQICWSDFKGKRMGEPVISLKEINTSYNVILLSYVMASKDADGALEYYNTEEYYRVRYASGRMYLLNFEREMNQIFRGENDNFYSNHIQLGIRDNDIQYVTNETGNIVCFVQEGELWAYYADEKRLSKVFGFRGYEGMDDRDNNPRHDIHIIRVDESGSMDFAVYGYMNRGTHEGENGIGVYRYNGVENTVEEELFLPYTKSYEIMKAELGRMIYENEKNQFYVTLGETLYEISMDTMEYTEKKTGLSEGDYAVSDSRQYAAWLEETDICRGKTIQIQNMEDGSSFEVTAADGEYIRPLGFMENDFIYGIAKSRDVVEDAAGNTIFPMYQICILDTQGEEHAILKRYQKDGYYISGIDISDYTIYLNRMVHNGTAYVDADQDTIMNREADTDKTVEIDFTVTDEKQTQYQLVMKTQQELKSNRFMTPRQIILEQPKTLAIERESKGSFYYAYARGNVLTITGKEAEAIRIANENMGVVIGDDQQYIWNRARKALQRALEVNVSEADVTGTSVAKSLNAMLGYEGINVGVQGLLDNGSSPKAILSETMQGYRVLDVSGCDMEAVLYYVNKKTPVFAMTSATEAVLITGYDANTVTIYDAALGTAHREEIDKAAEMFAQAGNIFLAYLKD